MPHTPQVGMYEEERQITDPDTDLRADVIDVAGVNRLAVDAVVVIGPVTPGATVTSPADVAVGVGATVALPVPPAGTTRMIVQNSSGGNTTLRVRELAGTAGAGFVLPRFGSREFGGEAGAIASLEVEHVGGGAGSALIQFEGP